MRWVSFSILAYLIVAIHVGLSGYVNWGVASPNLVLPVAVFVAINASRESALGGAFTLGVLQDLFSQQPPGLYAFSYGMVALFVVGVQSNLHRDHPLTHFFVTLAASLGVTAVALFNEWAYPVIHGFAAPPVGVWRVVSSALFTTAVAPLLLFPMTKAKAVFGFKGGKQRYGEGMNRF